MHDHLPGHFPMNAIERATEYWASEFGCSAAELFCQPLQIMEHGSALADYEGIFALFRDGAASVSFPPEHFDSLRRLVPPTPVSPSGFAAAFDQSFSVIGPAYIGYAEDVGAPSHPVRVLTENDEPAVAQLRLACTETEWDHGGSRVGEDSCSGVFIDGNLVSLAGYKTWPCCIAHLYVVTHPEFRGQGFARSAVAHLAGLALAAGLTPQYRTLESNRASVRVAESLGFFRFASSVAVRL